MHFCADLAKVLFASSQRTSSCAKTLVYANRCKLQLNIGTSSRVLATVSLIHNSKLTRKSILERSTDSRQQNEQRRDEWRRQPSPTSTWSSSTRTTTPTTSSAYATTTAATTTTTTTSSCSTTCSLQYSSQSAATIRSVNWQYCATKQW